jgi:DNA-binding CsgD family transcriptional regulator
MVGAMTRLPASDCRKALELAYAVGGVDGPDPFPRPILQMLRDLVPCDVVSFHERSGTPDRVLAYTGAPVGKLTPEIRAARARLAHEDPISRMHGARRLTDLVSLTAFRRTGFYTQVHEPLGIECMISLYLDPSRTDARFEFDRSECDFRERDVSILDLLLPLLGQALHAARRRRSSPHGLDLLTPRERDVLAHVARGRTNGEAGARLGISPETVRKHLENAYEKLGVHTRTAAVAATFGRPPPTRESADE